MGRLLTDGEQDILRELNADSFEDDATADALNVEADVIAEIYRDLDAARENQRLLEDHEQAHMAALLATETVQMVLWDGAPF